MNKRFFSLAVLALALGFLAENSHAQASGVKPELIMYRHNGGGVTPAPVVVNNILGTLKWNGLTAIGNIQTGATIKSVAKAVAPGLLSSNMIFSTQGTTLTERMIINEVGLVGIGLMNPAFNLDVLGNTHTSGRFFGRIHFDVGEPTNLPGSYTDEAYFERKTRVQLGLSANPYANGGILSLAPGGGSLDRQLFSGGDDGLWTRSQALAAGNTWAAWEKILTSGDINGRPNLVARFLPPGPLSSKLSDGQVYDNGANVVIGSIPAAPAVPAPVFDPSNMLTVKGNFRTDGNMRATGNATIDGNAAVAGNATVTGNTTSGSLNVSTNATVSGNTTTNSLNVTNNAVVGANTTTNSLNVNSNAVVAANTTTNSLNVQTNAVVNANISANTLTISANATANSLAIATNTTVGGNTTTNTLNVGTDATVNGTSRLIGKVAIGTGPVPTGGAAQHALYVGGSIIAEEVMVKLRANWPDYVFAKGYAVQPLSEVEAFIQQEQHLPGIPSAAEVAENGINLGEMQKSQMEKIEELYLHLIQQQKTIERLEKEITNLKK